jgi:hypothetical protein
MGSGFIAAQKSPSWQKTGSKLFARVLCLREVTSQAGMVFFEPLPRHFRAWVMGMIKSIERLVPVS